MFEFYAINRLQEDSAAQLRLLCAVKTSEEGACCEQTVSEQTRSNHGGVTVVEHSSHLYLHHVTPLQLH